MNWKHGFLVVMLAATASAVAVYSVLDDTQSERWPAPIDTGPGERGPDFKQQRKAWIESLHRHAPNLDWRAQDAQFRSLRMQRIQHDRQASLVAGATPESLRQVEFAAISGIWRERGSSNQAGRITGAIYDAANNRLTALSQGGNIWRSSRSTLAWTSPNDSASFLSSGFLDRLISGSTERLLLASDTPLGVYRSDNGGMSFSAATGTNLPNAWYTSGMAVRDASASDVYLARVHYDSSASNWRTLLFASTNSGTNFTSLGFVGDRDRVALFSPRYDSTEVFVLIDGSLKRIVSGTQALVTVGTVPVSPPVASGDRVHLAGGVDGGQTFLYALYSRGSAARTDVYRSLDGGLSWQARASVAENTFGPNSAASSTRDPNFVYVGGVDMYRSADGGASWLKVNNWGDYYANPTNKLHADIPKVDVWRDTANNERVFVSTDGGLYESTDNLATVHNLSLNGLHVSQYYSTYTQRGAARVVLAGAQDQGYQKALTPGVGIDNYEQVISGDYGHLTSSDGGSSVWMVYPGFAMLDTTPGVGSQSGLRFWDYAANNLVGTLWMAPIAADPSNPGSAMLAGGRMTATGNHVVKLTWSGSTFSAVQDSFDFGSQVTAVAFAPSTAGKSYVMNSARQFFRNAGAGWLNTASNLPENHYFYGNKILPDSVAPNTIYVAGAGYSNSPVFVSTNDGTSFTAMSTGLPNTLVFDLAMSPDGAHLFAATEVGPFYFDRMQNKWIDISGLGGPDQRYWDVDYVEEGGTGIARFATHGRGIWDFVVGGDVIFRNGFDN